MGNQPVYRYPPRSHASNCPCNRCVQCRTRKSPGGELIAMDMGCLVVVLLFAAIAGISGLVAKHPHAAVALVAGVGVLGVVIWGVVYANRRALRPPKGRLRVEATVPRLPDGFVPPSAALAPPPRICLHRNAVKVDSSVIPDLILCCWCPDCEHTLPATFRLPCCGTEPGTPHMYNCPYRKDLS